MAKTREEIMKEISLKSKRIESDNPQVEIAKLRQEDVAKLADSNNHIFSQLMKDSLQDETLDYTSAMNFARNPLSGLEGRLKRKGIKQKIIVHNELGEIEEEADVRIKVDMFESWLVEFLVRRHCLNRNRVKEYIDALDKANGKFERGTEAPRQGLLQRLG